MVDRRDKKEGVKLNVRTYVQQHLGSAVGGHLCKWGSHRTGSPVGQFFKCVLRPALLELLKAPRPAMGMVQKLLP